MNIKKIIREEMDELDWMRDISPSEEYQHGGNKLDGGYHWILTDYSEWVSLYNNLDKLKKIKPMWVITPVGSVDHEKYFNMYNKQYGNFNIFIPHDIEDVYGWFDNQEYAVDKRSNQIEVPNVN